MLSIDEINELKLLKGNYEALKKQNEELQTERNLLIKERDELKHLLKSERTRNRILIIKYNKLKEKIK